MNLTIIIFGISRVLEVVFGKRNLLESIRLLFYGELFLFQRIKIGANLIIDIISLVYISLLFVKIIKKYKK